MSDFNNLFFYRVISTDDLLLFSCVAQIGPIMNLGRKKRRGCKNFEFWDNFAILTVLTSKIYARWHTEAIAANTRQVRGVNFEVILYHVRFFSRTVKGC